MLTFSVKDNTDVQKIYARHQIIAWSLISLRFKVTVSLITVTHYRMECEFNSLRLWLSVENVQLVNPKQGGMRVLSPTANPYPNVNKKHE